MYEQGERILKLAEMCRRLETEEEKVLPFYASSLTDDENERVSEEMNEILEEPLCEVGLCIVHLPVSFHCTDHHQQQQ